MVLIFFSQCGSSGGGEKGPEAQAKKAQGKQDKPGERGPHGDRGQQAKEGEKEGDKVEMPERMKQAIKSGRISKERAMEMMKRRRGRGGQRSGPGGANLPTVKVEPVKLQRINAFLILNGTVEPERKVEVYSRLSAYVKEIVKEEGSFLKKNDVIALLDDTEIRFLHRQAQIQLEQAKVTLKDQEATYNRNKELKETNMISEQVFQAAQVAFDKARLDHETRQENYKDLELQLSYTRIKSPVEGYVTERLIEVGSRVNTNQHIYTVEDFFPLLVKVYVPTSDVVNLKPGLDALVFTDVLSGMTFEGKIKLINPRIDVQSGTVKVTVEVFDKSRKLTPGMFVETKILISNNPDAIVIPKKCVSYKREEAFVFVFRQRGRQVSRRVVKTGITEGDNIEILDGLEAGEIVVTVGVESLKDEMKVSIARGNQ
jgi:RND family efflux transporter MFP subunit